MSLSQPGFCGWVGLDNGDFETVAQVVGGG